MTRTTTGPIPWAGDDDPAWRAALYLFHTPILRQKNVLRYVDTARHEIDFVVLRRASRSWADSERTMVAAAAALFGSQKGCEVADLVSDLDATNVEHVIAAIRILRQLDQRRARRPLHPNVLQGRRLFSRPERL